MAANCNLLLFFAAVVAFLAGGAESRPAFACGGADARSYRFCHTELPIRARVQDLVGRLMLDEKVRLLVNNAAGVPRLGIGGYEWWSEALHGVSNTGPGVKFGGDFPGATSFPQVITSAASFNASLWELMGQVVSDEARAMYNGGQAGLTYWSPNVNVFRDPRWGRGQETPGEDPTIAARYASAYVQGLQGAYGGRTGYARLKLAACCKHYTAYDLDNWNGIDRFHFNAKVSEQDLEDTYDVPFKACVTQGKVASVMCSYNQVNGVPTCANPSLLKDTVRGEWHLDGYIVSDCDSVEVLYKDQHYTSSLEDAVADAIKAGLDLDCGPMLAVYTKGALSQGKLSMADVDMALTNTITVQMRLGMYDGDPARQPFGNLGPEHVCTRAHQNLALEAARQGVVLLKNDRGVLPLARSRVRTVAVVGPNADATATMIGNYAGVPCSYVSPLQGIGRYAKTIHQVGCTNVGCVGNQPIGAAVAAAQAADATVLVVGLDQTIEAEARDRAGLLLPGQQQELVTKVAAASSGVVVLVVMSGGPVDITFAKNNPRIAAILWVGYPGQAGGAAIADAIFGAFSPGGKLPMTWYPQEYVEKLPMTDMAMRADPARGYPGRTYRFYKGPVVYPFGYGLSYTKFVHSIALAPTQLSVPLDGRRETYHNSSISGRAVRVTHTRCDGLAMSVYVDVDNIGEHDGAQTVLVFSTPPVPSGSAPQKQLVTFEKVHVPAKSRARVSLNIDVCKDLSFADDDGIRRIPIGEHSLQIGDLTHSVTLKAESLRV